MHPELVRLLQRRPVLSLCGRSPVTASEAGEIVVWSGRPIVAPADSKLHSHVVHLSTEVSRPQGPLQRAKRVCISVSEVLAGSLRHQLPSSSPSQL